jgi:hypothetical protein
MKHIFTLMLLGLSFGAFAQTHKAVALVKLIAKSNFSECEVETGLSGKSLLVSLKKGGEQIELDLPTNFQLEAETKFSPDGTSLIFKYYTNTMINIPFYKRAHYEHYFYFSTSVDSGKSSLLISRRDEQYGETRKIECN